MPSQIALQRLPVGCDAARTASAISPISVFNAGRFCSTARTALAMTVRRIAGANCRRKSASNRNVLLSWLGSVGFETIQIGQSSQRASPSSLERNGWFMTSALFPNLIAAAIACVTLSCAPDISGSLPPYLDAHATQPSPGVSCTRHASSSPFLPWWCDREQPLPSGRFRTVAGVGSAAAQICRQHHWSADDGVSW